MTNQELINKAVKGYLAEKTGTRLTGNDSRLAAEWLGDRVVIRSYGIRIAAIFGTYSGGNCRVEIDRNTYSRTTSRHRNLVKAKFSAAQIHEVEPF